jgi:hypothetical protein
MNEYMAIINKPHSCVYRKRTTDEGMSGDSAPLKEIFGSHVLADWNSSDDKREFDRIDFYVNLATNDKPKDSTILKYRGGQLNSVILIGQTWRTL